MFDPARTRRGGGQTPQTDTTDRRTPRSARPFVVSPGRRRRCPTAQEVNHPFPGSWAHDKPENPNAERDGDDARQTTTGSAKTTRRIARLQESGRVCEKTPTPRQRKPSRPHPAESDPKLSPKQTDAEQGRTAKTWRIGAGKMEEPPRRCGEKTTREKAALNSQGPYQQRKRGKHSL